MNAVMGTHKESLFGVHLLVDAYNCDKKVLEDSEALLELLNTVPKEMGMRMISEPKVVQVESNGQKDPGGYSGFVMIAESHISFHTFPNRGFVTADVYTCKTDTDMDKLTHLFAKLFKTEDIVSQVIKRGTRYPDTDIH